MKFQNTILIIILLILTASCKKYEGEGGTSTITGKVYVYDYNSEGELKAEYYIQEEDVYIIYGTEDDFYDNETETSYDGSYRFDFLQNGTYRIFAYSDCDTCASEKKAVFKEIVITEPYTEYIIEDIIIIK